MCQDPVHDMCITQRKNALVIRHLWNAKLVLKSRGISDRLYTLFLNSGKKTKCFDCHFIYFFFFFYTGLLQWPYFTTFPSFRSNKPPVNLRKKSVKTHKIKDDLGA